MPSPRLITQHAFLRHVERNQYQHLKQFEEQAQKPVEAARMARRVGPYPKSTKPTPEIYRPPQGQKRDIFTRSINTINKFFDRRLELLEASNGYPRRWTAFVSLVTELFLQPRRQNCDARDVSFLATLLCNCCLVILHPQMLGNDREMECLQHVLIAAGSAVQSTIPWLTHILTQRICNAFVHSSVSVLARHTLLQLIELHASEWQLSAPQALYYHGPLVQPGFL
ncbi:hypothetical protein HPB49_023186 [Dermacentor silvarum]|uniref:Uncharacterized protein n=1 Tax=Dermacentor silvarum TaxID=543639 RepID=A0ACB8E498_DERSI|nr:hypothetical protein HPB49_023186 [Dermacentor silvarum]